jgi:riboflavin synthase
VSFAIRHAPWDSPLEPGESVAVQGVCLTVTAAEAGEFACDALQETLRRTDLGAKRPGAPLNLERALRLQDRLGGHLVTGHVDGTGTLLARQASGRDWILEIGCGPELMAGIVPKGSITCNGVSLTVAELRRSSFTVHLIPHTWDHTSLRALEPGEAVNLETDLIGKYVARALRAARGEAGLTLDDLQRAGFGGES